MSGVNRGSSPAAQRSNIRIETYKSSPRGFQAPEGLFPGKSPGISSSAPIMHMIHPCFRGVYGSGGKRSGYGIRQGFSSKGFFEIDLHPLLPGLLGGYSLAAAGDEDDGDIIADRKQFAGKVDSDEQGHGLIRNDEVEGIGIAGKDLQSFAP